MKEVPKLRQHFDRVMANLEKKEEEYYQERKAIFDQEVLDVYFLLTEMALTFGDKKFTAPEFVKLYKEKYDKATGNDINALVKEHFGDRWEELNAGK